MVFQIASKFYSLPALAGRAADPCRDGDESDGYCSGVKPHVA